MIESQFAVEVSWILALLPSFDCGWSSSTNKEGTYFKF